MNRDYKILIVDDDERLREIVSGWLIEAGYDVASATNRVTGLRGLDEEHPDVVVTDLSMPVMDGYEFCRRVRQVSTVPVLVFSGVAEKEGRNDSLRMGANDFASKNIGEDEFLRRVANLAVVSRNGNGTAATHVGGAVG